MLKRLSVKKEYLFTGAIIVLLLVCYQLAFKKTVAAWQLNSHLKAQLEEAANLTDQPAYLQRKNNNLNKILNFYHTDTVAFRSNAISAVAGIAEKQGGKLSEVPVQDPIYHAEQFVIEKLSFEGDFFALTKLLGALESADGVGVVRAVTYKTIRASNTVDSKKLVLEVYLEALK